MLASTGPLPHDDRWAIELKHDGVRAIVTSAHAGPVRIWSRNERDLARSFPELTEQLPEPGLVVDGEVVALDEAGRPDFELLQQRLGRVAPTPEMLTRIPVSLVVFDLLVERGESLMRRPYDQRRDRLQSLDVSGNRIQIPPNWPGTSAEALLDAATEHGLEGVIAKRRTSHYEPGRRSQAWIKHPIRHTTDVVILGWSPATGRDHARLGSLHVAIGDGSRLVPAGEVGTGFSRTTSDQLLAQLAPLHRDTAALPEAAQLPDRKSVV